MAAAFPPTTDFRETSLMAAPMPENDLLDLAHVYTFCRSLAGTAPIDRSCAVFPRLEHVTS